MSIKKALILSLFCVQSLAMEKLNDSREYLFRFGNITLHVGDKKDIEKFGYIVKYMQKYPKSEIIIEDKDSLIIDLKMLLEEIDPELNKLPTKTIMRFIELSKEPTLEYLKDISDSIEIYRGIFQLSKHLQNDELLNLLKHKNFKQIKNNLIKIEKINLKDKEKFDLIYEIIMDRNAKPSQKMKKSKKILETIKTKNIKDQATNFFKSFEKAVKIEKAKESFIDLVEKIKSKKGTEKDLKKMETIINKSISQDFPKELSNQMIEDYKSCKKLIKKDS